MLKRSRSHLRHNVVAYLALFLALGGTAVAAKPLVTGADVDDGSLTGSDIKDDSLTGQQVLEEACASTARPRAVWSPTSSSTSTTAPGGPVRGRAGQLFCGSHAPRHPTNLGRA